MKSRSYKKGTAFILAVLMAFGTVFHVSSEYMPLGIIASAEESAVSDVAVNETNFPDATFRQYVLDNFDDDYDGYFSEREINAVTDIFVSNNNISSLKGIEYFTALTTLYCENNQLTSLDLSKNRALTYLSCESNKLTSLDVRNNTALKYLYCYNNQLTSLDVSNNTALSFFNPFNNTYNITTENNIFNLAELNGFEPSRASYWTGAKYNSADNTITVTSETVKYRYDCGNGNTVIFTLKTDYVVPFVTAIDETSFPDDTFRQYVLDNFDDDNDNYLSESEINRATRINVSNEAISSLNGIEYFTALTYLDCSFNQLTSLDLSQNTDLIELYCFNNQLTSLDLSNNTALMYLWCFNNQLTSLDVSKNNALTDLNAKNNTYSIPTENNIFKLSDLRSFDSSKASDWTGAIYNSADNTIAVTSDTVTYNYDCGNGKTVIFTLNVTENTTPDLQTGITAVNSLFDDETDIKLLTALELQMIEIVLENDYNKAA